MRRLWPLLLISVLSMPACSIFRGSSPPDLEGEFQTVQQYEETESQAVSVVQKEQKAAEEDIQEANKKLKKVDVQPAIHTLQRLYKRATEKTSTSDDPKTSDRALVQNALKVLERTRLTKNQVSTYLDKAQGHLSAAGELLYTMLLVDPPSYEPSATKEGRDKLKASLEEVGPKAEAAKNEIRTAQQEWMRAQLNSKSEDTWGSWASVLKFVVLALMIVGTVIAWLYLRTTAGSVIANIAGLTGGLATGVYFFYAYFTYVIIGGICLLVAAVLYGGYVLVREGYVTYDIVDSIEEVKARLGKGQDGRIEAILSDVMNEGTKKAVKKAKKARKDRKGSG